MNPPSEIVSDARLLEPPGAPSTPQKEAALLQKKEVFSKFHGFGPAPFAQAVAFNWLVIAALFIMIHYAFLLGGLGGFLLCWLCTICIGARQHALFFLTHETAHRLICRNRTVNDFVGSIFCAFPIFITLDSYRPFHFDHHRKLGSDADPELGFYNSFRQWKIPSSFSDVAIQTIGDFVGLNFRFPLILAIESRPRTKRTWINYISFWTLTCLALSLFNLTWIIWVWLLSYATGFWWVQRVNTWCEHIGTTGTHRFTANWWQRFLFFPFNSWCHWEHHEFPQVPFFNLPALRDALTPSASIPTLSSIFPAVLSGIADPNQQPRRTFE